MRVTRGNAARKKRKKLLKQAKGYRGSGHRLYKGGARIRVTKAGVKSYRDRRKRKSDLRQLWIERLGAALESFGINYSTFINKLMKAKILLNRKILSDLAITDPETFKKIVEKVNK